MRSDTVYHGRIIDLSLEWITQPDGNNTRIEVVRHPGGAVVLPLSGEGQVCLLRQYRPAIDQWLWELPAGKIDNGEPPSETARRELREEAGLVSDDWSPLGSLVTAPGFCDEVIHLFLARSLKEVEAQPEPEEFIERHWIPFHEAFAMAVDGRIEDAKTVVSLFRAERLLDGR